MCGCNGSVPKRSRRLSFIGDRLKAIFESEGAETCSECAAMVQRLNSMSRRQVQAEFNSLVTELCERAKTKAPKLWQRLGARVDLAIGMGQTEAKMGEFLRKAMEPMGAISRVEVKEPDWLEKEPMGQTYHIQPSKSDGFEDRPTSDIFDSAYVISLKKREDRLGEFKSNLPVDWQLPEPHCIEAVDAGLCEPHDTWNTERGAWGCYRSHVNACERALSDGKTSVLFLEDDARPVEGFTAKFEAWLKHVPDNWQGLFLGGEHTMLQTYPKEPVNAHTLRCRYVTRTHAFAIRQPLLQRYYQFITDPAMQIENRTQHIDHAIARWMCSTDHAIYCPQKWFVGQAEGFSDIFQRNEKQRSFQ